MSGGGIEGRGEREGRLYRLMLVFHTWCLMISVDYICIIIGVEGVVIGRE